MFQGLTQGSSVSILYRNEPRIETGKVISATTHVPQYNPSQPLSVFNGYVTDLTVQVGNETLPFVGLPANGVVMDFPSKGVFLAIDSAAAYKEVDTAIAALEQDLATVPAKTQQLEGYKSLRAKGNPEAQREKELLDLRGEISELKRMLSAALDSKPKTE